MTEPTKRTQFKQDVRMAGAQCLDTLQLKVSALRYSYWTALGRMAIVYGVISLTIMILLLTFLAHPPGEEALRKSLLTTLKFRTNAAVVDRHGELIGSLPAHLHKKTTAKQSDRKGALLSTNPPPVFKALLMAREDAHLHFDAPSLWDAIVKGKRHYRGVDLYAMGHIVTGRGASTLGMQSIKNLKGLHYYNRRFGDHRSLSGLLARKWDEYRGISALWPLLRKNEGELFWTLVATTSPIISIGRTSRGLTDASILLFNKESQELTVGEQALLSAATFRQIKYDFGKPNKQNTSVHRRWRLIVKKAKQAAIKTYAKTNPKLLGEILNELNGRLRHPPTHIAFPRRIRGFIDATKPGLSPTLEDRLKHTLGSSYGQMQRELSLWRMNAPEANVDRLKLSIDWGANYGFKRSLDHILHKASASRGLSHKLTPLDEADTRPQANIHVRILNKDGQLLRVYKRGHHEDTTEPIASLGKLFALLPVLKSGALSDHQFCNRYAMGARNASGLARRGVRHCHKQRPGTHYRLDETIGRSLNLPILEAASQSTFMLFEHRKTRDDYWLSMYQRLGLKIDDPMPLADVPNRQRISAMVFGRVLGSPNHISQLSSQLFTILDAKTRSKIRCINNRIIAEVRLSVAGQRLQTKAPSADCQVRDYLKHQLNAQQTLVMRHLLRAPVELKGGTLHFARTLERRHKFYIRFAKTGTSQTSSKKTRAKWLVARLVDMESDEHYDITILVSARHDKLNEGLGRNIRTSNILGPILDVTMASLKTYPGGEQ